MVVRTIRPDTVFIPYHWPNERGANRLTIRAIDPISNIPEFKVCAVRIARVDHPNDDTVNLAPEAGGLT
jgi:assimilatory nitrate reductase catalytic subunit